jgi:ubiquinone/menaquinone biosynthesis C-methylase UbiE
VAKILFNILGGRGIILEVGCGAGRIVSNLEALCPDSDIVGIDFSDKQILAARSVCFKSDLFACDITEYEKKYFSGTSGEFDLIFVHVVTQYFPSNDYLFQFLESSYRMLKTGGNLILIDCSVGWYLEEMKSKPQVTLLSILKSRIRVLVPKFILSFIRRIKKKSVEGYVVESFGDIDLLVPIFDGFWINPQSIEDYSERYFTSYQMNFQPFKHKPIRYKKFGPIFQLLGKI